MRKSLLVLYFTCAALFCFAQPASVQEINKIVTTTVATEPLHFLASDNLMGRSPARPEINVAANYIRDQLKSFGVKEVEGLSDYLQDFELISVTPASSGSLSVNNQSFEIKDNFLQLGGNDITVTAPLVFVGYGNKEDLDNIDLKGKIAVANFGVNDTSTVRQGLNNINAKETAVREKGAIALIERFAQKDMPWNTIQGYLSRDRMVQKVASIPVFLLNADTAFISSLDANPQASLTTAGNIINRMAAKNVAGWVQGTDSQLKDQFIMLSAHYDHIGVAREARMVDGKMDSIYNGARDNAIGVTAVINAARYFAKHPPKRSVLFVFFTAEEMGLLGSRYFSDNSPVPLKKIVYNLNCDNGGYNDTSIVTVVGLGRTSADNDIKKACAAYGVKATPDPVPELALFDRSDNVNFAVKGIPSPTFGMGITGFDSIVQKYYHQLADEVSTFDLRYALVYIRSYILAAKNIADNKSQPAWIKNDKYEPAWKKLYTSAE
ncbi:MAG: M20/M25/M40 family metallo-hydrolase [Chitinophagaceae bacterium]|nr:M20/M25/M40 family metallo-hydrolase [Chitinophagaceae bacterium]